VNSSLPELVVADLELGHQSDSKGGYSPACRDLNFEVRRNEFVAIVGPSGSGKTTFLSAVAGLIPITSGVLSLGGSPIKGPGTDRSLVFQQASLFPWRNVRENIEFGLQAQGKLNAAGRQRVSELIDLVGLTGKGDRKPRELSGGMSQRVNLARALATDPDLLLLDEPFSALDAQTREVMQEELTRIWQSDGIDGGKTAIFITHDVPEAVFLADRVLVFSKGPAHLLESVDIPLERPRHNAIKRTPEFLALSDYILGLVMDQPQRKVTADVDHAGATR
jgi:NitT/TauT family transport system ATP-binding protein